MLRSGRSIRLTPREVHGLTILTGERPHVNTVDDLNRFIDFHVRQYAGSSPEEVLLRHLLESHRIPTDQSESDSSNRSLASR